MGISLLLSNSNFIHTYTDFVEFVLILYQTIMEKFIGKWEVTGVENMDEVLKACGTPEPVRQMYLNTIFILDISKNGGKWKYSIYNLGKLLKEDEFKVGEEFDTTTVDGKPIKSKVTIEGSRFKEIHKDKSDPTLDAEMVKEIINGELLVTAKIK